MSRKSEAMTEMQCRSAAKAMEFGVPITVGFKSTALKLAKAIQADGHEPRVWIKDQLYAVTKHPARVKG
jgi:hypothetical protein